MESKDKVQRKQLGFKRFKKSFGYSYDGLKYAYKNEQSMLVHLFITVVMVIVGAFLKLDIVEWLFCITMIGVVMGAELLNTAIEATVDMTMPDIHPLAKIAKDTASAAVGVLSVAAAIVGGIIFIPKIIEVIGSLL